MLNNRNIGKLIVGILCSVVTFATAISSWSFYTYSVINTGNTLTVANDDKCTVTVNVRKQSSNVITTTNYSIPTVSSTANSSFDSSITGWSLTTNSTTWGTVYKDTTEYISDSGNIMTHSQKHSVGQIVEEPSTYSETTTTLDDGSIVTETVFKRKSVYKIGETKTSTLYKKWWYLVQTELRKEVKTVSREAPVDISSYSSLSVKKGSKIAPIDIRISGYKNYGFYSDANYGELFDFTKAISEDTQIYARFIQTDTDISNTISNLNTTEYKLHDSYRGGSGSGYDVSTDPAYDEKTKTLFLDSATVKSGSTLDLTYGAEELYATPIEGNVPSSSVANHTTTTDYAIATDYKSTTYCDDEFCSLNIQLIGDLTIKGTLNIAAKTGGYNASTYYSYIIGYYAEIDLNGHNLIVDGGQVFALGVIKDSIGTGNVIVKNNGTITGTCSISDGRGRDQTVLGYSKRQTPFAEYRFPYIQANCIFYNGTTLRAYTKMHFNELGVNNVYFNVIGTTQNTSLFKWNSSNASGYILYQPYKIEALSTPANSTIYKNMYNWRTKFDINDDIILNGSLELSVSLTVSSNTVSGTFDLARVDSPIPPFWDIVVESGKHFELQSKMTLYPGSSFLSKEGSYVDFKYLGSKTYSTISKTALTVSLVIQGETRYICGGIMAYGNRITDAAYASTGFGVGVFAQSTYWTYIKPSNVRIEGEVTFDSSINTSVSTNDGKYLLSGPINLSSSALNTIKNNRNYLKTYDAKAELYGGFLYNADYHELNEQYEKATAYNVVPLMSGSKAFIIDNNHLMTGTYNIQTGVFQDDYDMSKYMLQMDTDMYEDGSSQSNQGSKIDRAVSIVSIAQVLNNKIVKTNDSSYYAFLSGLFVPVLGTVDESTTYTSIRVNARKFMSNNGAGQNANSAKYDDMTLTYSSSMWKYSSFTA